MFLQEFGNDFVLLLELRFQHFDFGQLGILLPFDIGRVRFPLKTTAPFSNNCFCQL